MAPQWNFMPAWWEWTLLFAIPPAIILLYFLKLKRKRIEVPSTFLWHKSIEDLHVNSLFQWLRQNILLFLQLLFVLLVLLTVARPFWMGDQLTGERFIFLIDNSASMAAEDADGSRLEEAKRQIEAHIDAMPSGAVAMLVSFANGARTEQTYTANKAELKEQLREIKQTQQSTTAMEALRLAGGLANPGRSSFDQTEEEIASDGADVSVAEAMPADLFIFSDGNFPTPEFSLQNLRPYFRPIGEPDAANIGIAAFSIQENEERPGEVQAYARLHNFGLQDATAEVRLYVVGPGEEPVFLKSRGVEIKAKPQVIVVDGLLESSDGTGNITLRTISGSAREFTIADDVEVTLNQEPSKISALRSGYWISVFQDGSDVVRVAASKEQKQPKDEDVLEEIDDEDLDNHAGVFFDLADFTSGVLELRIVTEDALETDNVAWAVFNPPRPGRILVVSPGNAPLRVALSTEETASLATTAWLAPEDLKTDAYKKSAAGGAYDLIVYDRCRPETPPQANTLYIGQLPKKDWTTEGMAEQPFITDVDRSHPLTRLVQMDGVLIIKGFSQVKGPPGTRTLILSQHGPMMSVGPREGFQDAVIAFDLIGNSNSNWTMRATFSFPVFVLNLVRYLGGGDDPLVTGEIRPGEPLSLRGPGALDKVQVKTPSGRRVDMKRSARNTFEFNDADELGVYEVTWGKDDVQYFAVNLFDVAESDVKRARLASIGYEEVVAQASKETAKQEGWKWLLLLGLGVLLLEWYVYNRRVSL
ncbi:MAG: BatA and WFA domain-containing protein [Planctomycetales bacterium]